MVAVAMAVVVGEWGGVGWFMVGGRVVLGGLFVAFNRGKT